MPKTPKPSSHHHPGGTPPMSSSSTPAHHQHHQFAIPILPPNLSAAERVLACGALTAIMDGSREGQRRCLTSNLHQVCVGQLGDPDPLLRRWLCITLGKLWCGYEDARFVSLRDGAHDRKIFFCFFCFFCFFFFCFLFHPSFHRSFFHPDLFLIYFHLPLCCACHSLL